MAHGSPPDSDIIRLLVEHALEYAIFVLDPEGRICTWNAGAERIKGYAAAEAIGRHFSMFYTEADRAAGRPARALATAEAEGRFTDEGWRVRRDGSTFWASVAITALRSPAGALLGFGKVTRDLSDRKRVEEELRQSEERFRLLVQTVRDYAIFMLDPDGRVASWNDGAKRIKGYEAGEVIGRHFSMFYPREDIDAGRPARELAAAASSGHFEQEGWRVRNDDSRFWANIVITPIRRADGALLGFAKVTRDLTEWRATQMRALEAAHQVGMEEAARRAAEERTEELARILEQLRAQAEELAARRHDAEAANRAKSEFLATMSHELRTPLNAIGGFVDLMLMGLRGPLTDEQRRDLERVRRSQQHLLGLINDILNFARLEAGQVSYHLAPVALAEAIDAVSAMLEPQAVLRELVFERRACPADVRVHADREKLDQVLLNLVSNAIKFTDAGGRVWIECTVGEQTVAVSVHDTGRGIAAEHLERIFEPFVQLHPSLTRTAEGTGLGLAISRDLARGMGGDLIAASELGRGSTFTLVLPRADRDSSGAPAVRGGTP